MRLLSDFSYIFLFSCIYNSSVLLSVAVEASPLLPVKPPHPFWCTQQPSECVGPWGSSTALGCPAHGVVPGTHLGLGEVCAGAAAQPEPHTGHPTSRSDSVILQVWVPLEDYKQEEIQPVVVGCFHD